MKLFIYKYYYQIIVLAIILSSIGIYIINNYNTGFLGGFTAGLLSAIALGLLVTPKSKFKN